MFKRTLLPLFLALLFLLPACAAPKSAFGDTEKIKIAATLFPQFDFARVVGGDRVSVIKLLPAGTESHTFEPTAADIVTVADADLFLYTGPDMEPWANTLISGIDSPPAVLDLSDALGIETTLHDDHDHAHEGNTDPHIWTSPKNAISMVEAIKDALCQIDPSGKDIYEANAAAYIQQLTALDADLTKVANEKKRNTLVFAGRFAFAHLCHDYGFDHISPYVGCDVEAQPSASDIAAVIDFALENDIRIVFYEELISPASVSTIPEETGATPLLLHSCHNVAKDEVDSASYLALMQENIKAIRRALCD